MASVVIPCPKCGSPLRLRDRSLLGKRGKCPRCAHGFVLEEPDEVELELADPTPMVGQAAQWVPDAAPARPAPAVTTAAVPDFAAAPVIAAPGVDRIRELRRRNAKRRKVSIVVGGVLAVLIVGSLFAVRALMKAVPPPAPPPAPVVHREAKAHTDELKANVAAATDLSPTHGEPISLKYVPDGATILIHLHPATLWQDADQFTEFRYALGPLATWAEAKIKDVCLFEPRQIDEALICLNLLGRGFDPEASAVVRLNQDAKLSDLVLRTSAAPTHPVEGGPTVHVGQMMDVAYIRHDARTFSVITPARQASLLAEAYSRDGIPSDPAVESILDQTDRDRHLTIVFPPGRLREHLELLLPEITRDFFNRLCLWFEDDVEAIAWSLHLGPEQLFSQFVLRNRTVSDDAMVVRPVRLEREMRDRLADLPRQLYAAVRMMDPQQIGPRKIIGRFPAMMKAASLSTLGGIGDRYVQLTTVLPERAAPNLAAGALLTWEESTRTDFHQQPAQPSSAQPQLPEKIADRLKMPLEIDFRRTPLADAFQYIGEGIKTPFEVDGDGLKSAGFTKNMPQDATLGVVPAIDGIRAILKKYENERDPIVIVVDEANQKVLVTTKATAAAKGLTPYEIK